MIVFAACVGCSSGSSRTSDESASAGALVDQPSPDITVVKAEALDPINGNGAPGFSDAECTTIDESHRDCTDAMAKRFDAPALHRIEIPTNEFFCHVLRVTTATRAAALDASAGIGFFYDGYGGEGRFVAKADLKTVGEAHLKNGERVVLHEFVGLANCWLGDSSSSAAASYRFKPYARFDGTDGKGPYRNWDEANDYVIRTLGDRFDRSSDVLASP